MYMSNHFNLSFDNCFQKSTKELWGTGIQCYKVSPIFSFLFLFSFIKIVHASEHCSFWTIWIKNFRQFMPETWKTGTWTFAYLNKLRQILYKVYSKEFLMQISSLYNVLDCNLALKGLLRRRVFKNSPWLNVNEGNWILDAVGWDI